MDRITPAVEALTEPLTFEHDGREYWLDHLGDDNPENRGDYYAMCDGEIVAEFWTLAHGSWGSPLPSAAVLIRLAKNAIDNERN